jgi:hypothetical protein
VSQNAPQSFEQHAHHPVPTYIATVLWLGAFVAWLGSRFLGWDAADVSMGLLFGAVFMALSIGRIYTVRLQDRVILLEMKVRCAEVLPAGEDARLAQLSAKQIVALRFASDAELGGLLDRAVREQLSPTDIKRAVSQWRADYHRT